MNKKMYKKILLGGLSLLALAGCQKSPFDMKGGREVVFTAASGAGTKAAYATGDNAYDGNYQRIDWQVGDDVVIFSDKAETPSGEKTSVYLVKEGITSSGATSKAQLDNQGAGLRYLENVDGPYKFAGAFPSTGLSFSDDGTTATVNCIIHPEQIITGDGFPSMKQEALLLADPVSVDKDASVSLNFRPVFTTFEFTLAAEKDMKLTGFFMKSESSTLNGGFDSVINLNTTSPSWSTTVSGGTDQKRFIQGTINNPLQMTLPEGGTKTNEVKFGVYTTPTEEIKDLTFTFYVQYEEDGRTVNATRNLKVTYAKDGNGYSKGDPVKFAGGLKHNITGITIPANLSTDVELVLAVVPWVDKEGSITYGPEGEAITALAIDYVSGNAVTSGARRTQNNFADDTNPIVGYFYAFAPTNAQWKISISGDTDKFVVTSPEATSTSSTELKGPVEGRVNFQIERTSTTATTDEIKLNFALVFDDGREVSINSEVTRANALTITGKVGNN